MEEPIDCGQNWFQWLGGTTFQIKDGSGEKNGGEQKKELWWRRMSDWVSMT